MNKIDDNNNNNNNNNNDDINIKEDFQEIVKRKIGRQFLIKQYLKKKKNTIIYFDSFKI